MENNQYFQMFFVCPHCNSPLIQQDKLVEYLTNKPSYCGHCGGNIEVYFKNALEEISMEDAKIIQKKYTESFKNGTSVKIEIKVNINNFNNQDKKAINSEYARHSHNFYLALADELNNIS